jgi:hypothetical protein
MRKVNRCFCSICGAEYWGDGHNAAPVKEEGRCCDRCNAALVVPTRLAIMRRNDDAEVE